MELRYQNFYKETISNLIDKDKEVSMVGTSIHFYLIFEFNFLSNIHFESKDFSKFINQKIKNLIQKNVK